MIKERKIHPSFKIHNYNLKRSNTPSNNNYFQRYISSNLFINL